MEERVEAIHDVGGEDEYPQVMHLAETPPTGHGRRARRQHISRLQKKEQEDGKQRGGSALNDASRRPLQVEALRPPQQRCPLLGRASAGAGSPAGLSLPWGRYCC